MRKSSTSRIVHFAGVAAAGVAASCVLVALAQAGDNAPGAAPDRQVGTSPPFDGRPSVTLPPCERPMSVKIDLSTGTTNGTPNAVGAADPKWHIGSTPAGSGVTPPTTYSIMAYYSNNGTWAIPTGATWIQPYKASADGNANSAAPNGHYIYSLSFFVPAGYTSIQVGGTCRADDGATMSLGSNSSSACGGYNGAAGPAFNFAGALGANTLQADVQNTGGGPTGLLANAAVTAECRPLPPIPQGDHYLCYNTDRPWKEDVVLHDQFGAFKFHAYAITRLCNPVEKRHGDKVYKIERKDLHYVCYRGETQYIDRAVRINNQFGLTDLKLKGPTELCLPSGKMELGRTDMTDNPKD